MKVKDRVAWLAAITEPWVKLLVKRGFDAARAELYTTIVLAAFAVGLAIAIVVLVPAAIATGIWWFATQ